MRLFSLTRKHSSPPPHTHTQKFPLKRSDGAYASGGEKPNGAKSAGQQANSPSNAQAAGQQQQYSALQIGTEVAATDKQLRPNGLPAINSFQLSSKNSKQCEIHHNVLHPLRQGAGKKAKANFCRAWLNKFPSRSKRIDVISRIFFPKMFALFNLVYWTTYLFREDDTVRS